jgi:hypothetical protein
MDGHAMNRDDLTAIQSAQHGSRVKLMVVYLGAQLDRMNRSGISPNDPRFSFLLVAPPLRLARSDHMALESSSPAATRTQRFDFHLSTLNGLHVIPAKERELGNVFQATIRGRWESQDVFPCITGERLIVDADGRAQWGVDDWQGLKPFHWGLPSD